MADEVRMIDGNALKEDFMNDYHNYMMESLRGNHHDVIRISNVIERIEDAPTIEAQPDNGWISVKDEMPKLGQRVMAFCRAGILTFLRYDGEVWFEMSSRNEYLLSFVTHWQYLPEPPKGE